MFQGSDCSCILIHRGAGVRSTNKAYTRHPLFIQLLFNKPLLYQVKALGHVRETEKEILFSQKKIENVSLADVRSRFQF